MDGRLPFDLKAENNVSGYFSGGYSKTLRNIAMFLSTLFICFDARWMEYVEILGNTSYNVNEKEKTGFCDCKRICAL